MVNCVVDSWTLQKISYSLFQEDKIASWWLELIPSRTVSAT